MSQALCGACGFLFPFDPHRFNCDLLVYLPNYLEDFQMLYQCHSLKGDRQGVWSMTVSGNWRITFEFINGDAYILNYEDYH